MKLKDITVRSELSYIRQKEFNLRTHCVTSMYWHYLGDFDGGAYKKILIELSKDNKNCFEDLLDVLKFTTKFNFEFYWESKEPKKIILNVVYDSLVKVSDYLGWDKEKREQLAETYNTLKPSNLDFIVDFKRPISSPDRKKQAQLRYYYDMDKVRLVVRVTNKSSKEIHEYDIIETMPHEIMFVPYLGKLRWVDKSTLKLEPKDKKIDAIKVVVDL